MRLPPLSISLFLSLVFGWGAGEAKAQAYVETLLPKIAFSFAEARGINDAGLIVGGDGGFAFAALWTPAAGGYGETLLPKTSSFSFVEAMGINSTGLIVGGDGYAAAVWTPVAGGYGETLLPKTSSSAEFSFAMGINDAGLIVGGDGFDAALWTPLTDPAQLIQNLINSTLITNLAAGIENQLDAKLSAALATVDAANANAAATAANQLQAFVNAVAADVLSGRLTCAQATPLIAAAQNIVAALGEPPLSVSLPCP